MLYQTESPRHDESTPGLMPTSNLSYTRKSIGFLQHGISSPGDVVLPSLKTATFTFPVAKTYTSCLLDN